MKGKDLEEARAAAERGDRQEWKVTFYEIDEYSETRIDGGRKFTLFPTTSPFASARPTTHAMFLFLHGDPEIPPVHMTDYDIEKTRLVSAKEDKAPSPAPGSARRPGNSA